MTGPLQRAEAVENLVVNPVAAGVRSGGARRDHLAERTVDAAPEAALPDEAGETAMRAERLERNHPPAAGRKPAYPAVDRHREIAGPIPAQQGRNRNHSCRPQQPLAEPCAAPASWPGNAVHGWYPAPRAPVVCIRLESTAVRRMQPDGRRQTGAPRSQRCSSDTIGGVRRRGPALIAAAHGRRTYRRGNRCQTTAFTRPKAVTNGIRVAVTSQFSHLEAREQRWYFTYTVRIANEGTDTVQLVSRHWIITNGSNEVQEVKGLGVVGRQPDPRSGAGLRVHVRLPSGHTVRFDARHLPDADPEGRRVRSGNCGIRAHRTLYRALGVCGESPTAFDWRCIPRGPRRIVQIGVEGRRSTWFLGHICQICSLVTPCHAGAHKGRPYARLRNLGGPGHPAFRVDHRHHGPGRSRGDPQHQRDDRRTLRPPERQHVHAGGSESVA